MQQFFHKGGRNLCGEASAWPGQQAKEWTGSYIPTEALVTSAMKEKMFLSWGVLIAIGVVSEGFPRVTTGLWRHMARTVATRDLDSVIEKFADVFGEDLSGGRCLCGRMHIYLKDGPIVPHHVKGARRPPQARQQACKEYLEM